MDYELKKIKTLTTEDLDKIFAEYDQLRIYSNGYEPGEYTKFEFVCDEIFELATYDTQISDEWGRYIYEVLCVIKNRTTFEYMEKNDVNYNIYLLVCNKLESYQWITWGTSIRGAWFDESEYSRPIEFCYCGVAYEFSEENITTLIEWLSQPREQLDGVEGEA